MKVADVSSFWNGQKKIQCCDPNILACPDKRDLLEQYKQTGAQINFNQGLDIRLMNEDDMQTIRSMRIENLHFAWDNAKDNLQPAFAKFASIKGAKATSHGRNGTVFVLTNYNSTMDENLYRIYTLRDLGFKPYVMIYNKPEASQEIRHLARWVNNPFVFYKCKTFEEYDNSIA